MNFYSRMSLNSSDEALLDASENASENNDTETENKEIVREMMEQILNLLIEGEEIEENMIRNLISRLRQMLHFNQNLEVAVDENEETEGEIL